MTTALQTPINIAFQQSQIRILKRRIELQMELRKRQNSQNAARQEWLKCANSVEYFIETYCQIYDTSEKVGKWIPFELWDAQREVLKAFDSEQKVIVLKARQNGLTWLALAYALHQMLFNPIATVLAYSLRDNEAVALLAEEKMYGMYQRLPAFLKHEFLKRNDHKWRLTNGSNITALPTTAGDSYTATIAIVDEADLVPDLNKTLQRVKPTIDAGGKLFLISRSNKLKPQSDFKKIYRAAKKNENGFKAVFLPWDARPSRTQEWYEQQKRESLATTGAYDNLYESYPATDAEALAPATLNKRLPSVWLTQCYLEATAAETFTAENQHSLNFDIFSKVPNLKIFALPKAGESYRIGVDTAEGNPTSDDTSINVVNLKTGEQVAVAKGKFEPKLTAVYVEALSKFYNFAPVLVERNNHGHAVLLALSLTRVKLLKGDDDKDGWLDNRRGKVLLYNNCADTLRTGDCVIRDFETLNQLSLIEGNTLDAPEGESDDVADSFALAQMARTLKHSFGFGTFAQAKSKGWMKKK